MADPKTSKRPFIGLQLKIMIPLVLLFAVILVVGYFALDGFIKDMIMNTFQEDIKVVSNEAGNCLDAQTLLDLANDAVLDENDEWPDAAEDPRYQEQVEMCVASIVDANERSLVYTYYIMEPGGEAFVGLDSDSVFNPDNIWPFGQTVSFPGNEEYERYVRGLSEQTFDPDYYIYEEDGERLVMVKGYAPVTDQNDELILNEAGQPMVGLVVEMSASKMLDQLVTIKTNLLFGLVIAFVVLLLIVFLITLGTTSSLRHLTQGSGRVAEGDYTSLSQGKGLFADETSRLTETFNFMVDKVRGREESLKQQVQELQIIIDNEKKDKQVEEVTGSEFFQDLQSRARQMRRNRSTPAGEEEKPAT